MVARRRRYGSTRPTLTKISTTHEFFHDEHGNWRHIPQFHNLYYASDCGYIKSRFNRILRKRNKGTRVKIGHTTYRVADLIAETFIGDEPKRSKARYKDGNARNHSPDNIYYACIDCGLPRGSIEATEDCPNCG